VEAHEEPESINWPEFRAAFHAHHVPQGVIKLKKKEFQDLKQGSMSLNESRSEEVLEGHLRLVLQNL
jgi:hypothetical protein